MSKREFIPGQKFTSGVAGVLCPEEAYAEIVRVLIGVRNRPASDAIDGPVADADYLVAMLAELGFRITRE